MIIYPYNKNINVKNSNIITLNSTTINEYKKYKIVNNIVGNPIFIKVFQI